jgi:hypothetical protein
VAGHSNLSRRWRGRVQQLHASGRDGHLNRSERGGSAGGADKAGLSRQAGRLGKESRETGYWLRLSVAAGLLEREQVDWELGEADQLRG